MKPIVKNKKEQEAIVKRYNLGLQPKYDPKIQSILNAIDKDIRKITQ